MFLCLRPTIVIKDDDDNENDDDDTQAQKYRDSGIPRYFSMDEKVELLLYISY